MQTEGVELEFSEDGIETIAEIAHTSKRKSENIGARRLHTVNERFSKIFHLKRQNVQAKSKKSMPSMYSHNYMIWRKMKI